MESKTYLGQKMTDQLTGYTGTVTGICEYLTGCRQFLLDAGRLDEKSGEPLKGVWFDESRVIAEFWHERLTGMETAASNGPGESPTPQYPAPPR